MLGLVRVCQGLSDAFALVVARAGPEAIDVAEVGFRLDRDSRIAVDLCVAC